jgi:hypothetical protein
MFILPVALSLAGYARRQGNGQFPMVNHQPDNSDQTVGSKCPLSIDHWKLGVFT